MRRLTVLLGIAAAMLVAVGCGGTRGPGASGPRSAPIDASLALDFVPNAIHAGIYAALARREDLANGVSLRVFAPAASTDSLRWLESGRVSFAVLDIHDLALARARGVPVIAVMAIVERPLSAVIAAPSFSSPRDLRGQTVGITGVPSDTAVLDSILAGDGASPRSVHTITIGFNAVPDLLAGRVAAATAFWNDEGVAVTRARPGFHVFRLEAYGAPRYPELLLCVTPSTVHRSPRLVRSVVRALVAGYSFTLRNPAAAAGALEARVPGLDPGLVRTELAGELSAFRGPSGTVGELDPATLRSWARWESRHHLVPALPDLSEMFDPAFLPSR